MTGPRTTVPHATTFLRASALDRCLVGPGDSTVVVESFLDGREATTVTTDDHDGQVVLPTILPVDDTGAVVAPGDFVAQYAWCLDRADVLLREQGLTLAAAVTTFDYSTPATRDVYRRTHRERKDRLGGAGVFPGAGGILMSRLAHPDALVALEVTASRHPLTVVNPGWSRYDTLTYAPGVRAGRTLYMSGFAALDLETQQALHEGDLRAQAEVTYGAVLEVLAAAGAGPEHLTSLVEFVCPDGVPQAAALAEVRRDLLGPDAPAPTTAVCAGLLRPEFLLEVFPTAVVP